LLEILYEDNHIIAVNKKSGDIVQIDKTEDKPLEEMVQEYIAKKYNKPGRAFVGVIHRLDRPVSGVILFARTSKAQERLNLMFKNREMKKTYWAVVKNIPEPTSGTLIHFLVKNPETNITTAHNAEVQGSQRAELHYKLIAKIADYYLIEVDPITGRPHQIRVQLASLGCPIRGDKKYGFSKPNSNHSINLHARKIKFIHPIKKEEIEIFAPLPSDSFWQQFEKI